MPYITKVREEEIFSMPFPEIVGTAGPLTKGDLNLIITRCMKIFLYQNRLSYQTISDAIAAAQDAADECKRRVLATYEDKKISDPLNVDPWRDIVENIRSK